MQLGTRDQWTRQNLSEFQQQQLSSLVMHDISHSPFYGELYSHIDTNKGVFVSN
jgi:phenylacetate-coenzyme A ligase PaaK-like adenylate-forming protein